MKKIGYFIREEYILVNIVKFDFVTVKLYTDSNKVPMEYQLAVFTFAYSNYRGLDYSLNKFF